MKSPAIKQINRQTSLQAIGLVLFANLILALIYYKTLFVWQARINMSQLDSLSLEGDSQVCQTGALQDYADSSVYPPCERHHKLKVSFQLDQNLKKQALVQIHDENSIVVKVKQWSKVPRDFWQVLDKQIQLLGYQSPKSTPQYALNRVNTLQFDLYGLKNEHHQVTDLIISQAEVMLDKIWKRNDPRRPKVYLSKKHLSSEVAPQLFTEIESDRYLDQDQVIEFVSHVNQQHQIQDWSLPLKTQLKHVRIGFFSELLSHKFVKKASGQTSDVVRSNPQELSFAIVNFSADDDLKTKVNKVLRLAFYEVLGIDSFAEVQAYGRRRQIEVEDLANLDQQSLLSKWVASQKRIEKTSCLQQLKNVVQVLNENSIESDKPVYGKLTVAELVEEVFEQLQGTKDGDDLYSVQEKLGILQQTKTLNPPTFFSFDFKMGVYLPILSAFVVPLTLTVWLILRTKVQLMFKKETKIKSD